jgi:O-antigen/teichoic acid export membrane protein
MRLRANGSAERALVRRLAKNAGWSMLGVVLSRALALGGSVVVARALGVKAFGELGIVQTTLSMFVVFASGGLGATATKYVASRLAEEKTSVGRILGLVETISLISSLVFALALLVSARWVSAVVLGAPQLVASLKVCALALVFSAMHAAQLGALAGFESYRTVVSLSTISSVLQVAGTVGGAKVEGVYGAAWGIAIAYGITWLIARFVLKRVERQNAVEETLRGMGTDLKVIWSFSAPALLASLVVVVATWGAGAIVVNQNDGYAEMGFLNVALNWRTLVLFAPSVFANTLLPVLSQYAGIGDRAFHNRIVNASALGNLVVALCASLAIGICSSTIMRAYGEGYAHSSDVLLWILPGAIIAAYLSALGQSFASQERMWPAFCINLLWGIVFIGSAWALRGSGAVGYAKAYTLSYLFQMISMYTVMRALGLSQGFGRERAALKDAP